MLTVAEIIRRHPEVGSKRTVLRAAERGDLKAVRVGLRRMWLISEQDLADWLKTRDLPIYQKD
jgi:excisionase family DNA binding protein